MKVLKLLTILQNIVVIYLSWFLWLLLFRDYCLLVFLGYKIKIGLLCDETIIVLFLSESNIKAKGYYLPQSSYKV